MDRLNPVIVKDRIKEHLKTIKKESKEIEKLLNRMYCWDEKH